MEKAQPVSKKEKKNKMKELFANKAFVLIFLKQFSIIVLIYGLIFNLTFYSLFNLSFNLFNLLSLGFLTYFIKEEIPDIVRACKN